MRACGLAGLLLVLSFAARADEPAPEPRPWEFGIEAAGYYGSVSGFVQVPLGGNSGSTSPDRPRLDELGIHSTVFYEVTPRFRWHDLVIIGGYRGMELSSSGTLSQSLVSHGVFFAANSPFQSDVELNVGNIGAGWRFSLADGRLELTPKIDAAILDFSYSLDSPSGSAKRDYRVTAMRLGIEGAWRLGHGLAIELDGVASLPVDIWPQLAGVTARVSYLPFPDAPVRPKLFLGLGARWIDYQDSQGVPNHIHVSTGALFTGGIAVAF